MPGVRGAAITRALMTLAKHTKDNAWWYPYTDVIPTWFDMYLGLEATADTIHEYAPELVPGLLQTEACARAVFALPGGPVSQAEIDRRIDVRMRRRDLLARETPAPLRVQYFLNEAVLRRPVGGPLVMAQQLARIAQTSELPNVDIRLIPFSAGAHSGAGTGLFAHVRFEDGREPDVIYHEQLTGALYLESPQDIERYKVVLADLGNKALGGQETRALIADLAKEYHDA